MREKVLKKQMTQRKAAGILGLFREASKKSSQKGAKRRFGWNNSLFQEANPHLRRFQSN
ncbi:MAG: hypothetical protein QME07_02980 [bacterium]|nr:hypothetical protein [bacterium]